MKGPANLGNIVENVPSVPGFRYLLPKKNMLDGEQQRLREMLRSKLARADGGE